MWRTRGEAMLLLNGGMRSGQKGIGGHVCLHRPGGGKLERQIRKYKTRINRKAGNRLAAGEDGRI